MSPGFLTKAYSEEVGHCGDCSKSGCVTHALEVLRAVAAEQVVDSKWRMYLTSAEDCFMEVMTSSRRLVENTCRLHSVIRQYETVGIKR